MRRKVGYALAVLLAVALCWLWSTGKPVVSYTDDGEEPIPRLVRFRLSTGDTGTVLYASWRELGGDRRSQDSVQVRNGRGDILFDGTWGVLYASVLDTVSILETAPLRPGP